LPSFAFRGKASNAGEIGHKLGVRYLVEESVALAAMLPVVLSNLKRIIARE
jgi:TolB-like protein